MADTGFAAVVEAMQTGNGAWMPPLPENWMQGRTCYGGLTAALMLEAAQAGRSDLPPLRSAMINFIGPVSAPPEISRNVVREGRNVTAIETRSAVHGKTVATAAFSFGQAVAGAQINSTLAAPAAPEPLTCEDYIPAFAQEMAPKFTRNFETKLIEGERPLTGAQEGYIRCWSRHRDPASRRGMAALFCLADVLPPGIYPMLKRPGPNSSMNWLCNFLDENPQTEDGWWQVETRMTAAGDGYSSQVMRVWSSNGKLVIEGLQACLTFA